MRRLKDSSTVSLSVMRKSSSAPPPRDTTYGNDRRAFPLALAGSIRAISNGVDEHREGRRRLATAGIIEMIA